MTENLLVHVWEASTSLVTQTVKFCQRCGRPRFSPWIRKIPLEKEMAPHSSTFAWKIPWSEEPGRLQSTGSPRVGHNFTYMWVHVQLCPTLCDPMDCSLPGSSVFMEFSRQECWSELPFPSPGDLPDPGIQPVSPMPPALAGGFFTTELSRKPLLVYTCLYTNPVI